MVLSPVVRYVEIIVELACKAGGGGGDTVRVESRLVRFASTPESRRKYEREGEEM